MKEIKEYKILDARKTKDKGFSGEGYESVLTYVSWLALMRVTLTKSADIRETLDVKNIRDINELYEFVDKCKEQGLTDIDVDYDIYDDSLDGCSIIATRKLTVQKTQEELEAEYFRYVDNMNRRNKSVWDHHISEKRKADEEYATYQRLKFKFEGKI